MWNVLKDDYHSFPSPHSKREVRAMQGFPGGASGKEHQCRRRVRRGSDPWVEGSPGGGHGNSLQCSCLENPMDRGGWQAVIHRVAKSCIPLKWFSTCTRDMHWKKMYDRKNFRQLELSWGHGLCFKYCIPVLVIRGIGDIISGPMENLSTPLEKQLKSHVRITDLKTLVSWIKISKCQMP